MSETIKSIRESSWGRDYDTYSGFVIETTEQNIMLGIDNNQNCCEDWGYLLSEDDFDDYVGADILSITTTDTALKTYNDVPDSRETTTMFININTSKGLLQFVAYNNHNGYYRHTAVVISKQLNDSEYL